MVAQSRLSAAIELEKIMSRGVSHPWAQAKKTVRSWARYGALELLSRQAHARGTIERNLRIPRISLPYLHSVPPHAEARFRELLRELSKTHTFISYAEAMMRIQAGKIDRPYVAFSFDDGFASNARTARILEEFGATGCFFVPTDFIGVETVSDARDFFGFVDGVDEPAMTWSDLETLKERGHMVENHTARHNVLSWITETQYEDEIGRAAEVLRRRLGSANHFAWPRGRFSHFNAEAARVVFATGHETCASAERGAHVVKSAGGLRQLCIRRDHLMAEWPLHHSLYFLATSAAKSTVSSNEWPSGWDVADSKADG